MKSVIEHSFQCFKIDVCLITCNVAAHCFAAFGVSLECGKCQVLLYPFIEFVKTWLLAFVQLVKLI